MISIVQAEPLFKSKVFLQQKYLLEGLSAGQIAREISSARSTVTANLEKHGVGAKPRYERHSRGQVKYGEKLVKGQIRPHKGELAIIHQMALLRASGASYGKIVNWLNSKQVLTKNRASGWDRPTVYKILSRQQGASFKCPEDDYSYSL